jgi:nitrite reductase/ring-hydroxylating ferredoxin subunit/multimeric flavodoxin WrbA
VNNPDWRKLGPTGDFDKGQPVQVMIDKTKLAVTSHDGRFGVVSGVCNHAAGPLGDGTLAGGYLVCPWHHWKFHFETGKGEPGFEDDRVPSYTTKVEDGALWVDLSSATKRTRKPHAPHPLARPFKREPGPIRVAGISTTAMEAGYPRFSTSDFLLEKAVARGAALGESKLIKLNDLTFRSCEGFYSKSAHACTWPCSITQMDPNDQLDRIYEALVHWSDVIVISTPIRWGSASSLYYKMAERLNCIQNQITIADRTLIKNKVIVLIITGGQDNIQAVAGQMLGFFAELGFLFPQYPYIAHSRGWTAEDMERNIETVRENAELQNAAECLVERGVELAKTLLATPPESYSHLARGGRKAHPLKRNS